MFERRAAGAGPTELGELLERAGVRTSQGSAIWSRQAVKTLLKNRVYRGELRSAPYVNTEAHEPIVDEATWQAANRRDLTGRRRRPPSPYLLSGVLRCAGCGYSMQGTHDSHGKRIYRCIRRHAGGICPEPARIVAAVADEAVLAELRQRVYVPRETAASVDLAPLVAALESAERRLEQALTPDVQDALGDKWAGVVRERRQARDEAAATLGEARARGCGEKPATFWETMRTFDFDDPDLPVEEKRAAVASVFGAIACARDKTLDMGVEVADLSRPGFRRAPKLNPLRNQATT
jgi:hypothetical protein